MPAGTWNTGSPGGDRGLGRPQPAVTCLLPSDGTLHLSMRRRQGFPCFPPQQSTKASSPLASVRAAAMCPCQQPSWELELGGRLPSQFFKEREAVHTSSS